MVRPSLATWFQVMKPWFHQVLSSNQKNLKPSLVWQLEYGFSNHGLRDLKITKSMVFENFGLSQVLKTMVCMLANHGFILS